MTRCLAVTSPETPRDEAGEANRGCLHVVLVVVALAALMLSVFGCSTLPHGWSTANPDIIAAVANQAKTVIAEVGKSDARLAAAITQTSKVGAVNYLSTSDSGLSQEVRLTFSVQAADAFSKLAFPDVANGHRFGWIALQVLPALAGCAGSPVNLTEAEAALGFILAAVRTTQAKPTHPP